MNINKIRIKNFKSIEELNIKFNDKFNVIIGENNIGKTTILEAMLLWKKCYDTHIQQNKKKFYAKPQNILFKEVSFLRVSDDIDLFNKLNKKSGSIEVEITFIDKDREYNLGFEIGKVNNIDNAYFQLKYINKYDFIEFEKLAESYNKTLNNFIVFFETRPIASIVSKEPYMYKDQVLSKIAKGKGYEVLRNKIIGYSTNKEIKRNIEKTITSIIGEEIEFIEKNQNNKEYIKLMVKKDDKTTDLLSQGSGFIQITEIFSSIEYVDAELYILLIDEPDSHIHAKLQSKLLKEFRDIRKSQLFLITHNERFMSEVDDEEVIFINTIDKHKKKIQPLQEGTKALVVENLVGNLDEIEELKYSDKVVFVEGPNDKKIIQLLYKKYIEITNDTVGKRCYFDELKGIDKLDSKLQALSQSYRRITKENISWILVRDTDFTPIRGFDDFKRKVKTCIRDRNELDIIFQNGYGIESTLFGETDKFVEFIYKYYECNISKEIITPLVKDLNDKYLDECSRIGTTVYNELKSKFEEQLRRRRDNDLYKTMNFEHFICDMNNNIQYIMNKNIIDKYLADLDSNISILNSSLKYKTLTNKNLIETYIENIDSLNGFCNFHLDLLVKIYEINYNLESEVELLVEN